MIESLFQALSAGLGIWKSKESKKYLDKLLKLEKKYYEAINKSEEEWDDAVIDNISFELCILSKAFNSSIRAKDSED
tara:strand:+ start:530 stop:760 length:231 start_codon:yes stop_codon:yes gene_type:complete